MYRQTVTCPAEGRVGRVPFAYALLRHMVMPSPVFDCVSPGSCEANRPLDLPLMWLSLWTNKTCVPPCREAFLMELNCHFDIGKTARLPMSVAITLEGRYWSWPLWLNICQGLVLTHTAAPVLVDILLYHQFFQTPCKTKAKTSPFKRFTWIIQQQQPVTSAKSV